MPAVNRASQRITIESFRKLSLRTAVYGGDHLGAAFCANRLIFLKGKDAMNNQSVIPAFDFREMVTTLDKDNHHITQGGGLLWQATQRRFACHT
jgi:hypothetical protein